MPFTDCALDFVAKEVGLSPRQKQIVVLLLKGYADKQIAQELGICLPTVRTHMSRLFAKCNACDRCDLLIHLFMDARRASKCEECPLFA
jgi:DNA-binding NarL/FixJ family response regulator